MNTTVIRAHVLTLCGICAAGMMNPGTAQASTVYLDYQSIDGNSSSFDIKYKQDHGTQTVSGLAGLMTLSKTDSWYCGSPSTTLKAYCIELEQDISDCSTAYTQTTGLSCLMTADESAGIARLWAHYDAGKLTGNSASAFQLAVWNVLYDTDYTVDKGDLSIKSGSQAVRDLANSMLTWLKSSTSNDPSATLTAYTSNCYQNLITGVYEPVTPVPVPEPATLGIAGLAVLGLVARKHRKI